MTGFEEEAIKEAGFSPAEVRDEIHQISSYIDTITGHVAVPDGAFEDLLLLSAKAVNMRTHAARLAGGNILAAETKLG